MSGAPGGAPTGDRARTPGSRDIRGWRQARCAVCGLTEAHCLCATLPTIPVKTQVIVVMHFIEAQRSTNTGRLAARVLGGATVRLRGDREGPVEAPAGRRLVLFPFENARALTRDDAGPDVTLVVPDGTWSQARRIARRDPCAVGAEPVTLAGAHESAYGLRRNPREGGLCTMEAIAEAMRVLEGDAVADAMHRVFEAWRAGAMAVREGR